MKMWSLKVIGKKESGKWSKDIECSAMPVTGWENTVRDNEGCHINIRGMWFLTLFLPFPPFFLFYSSPFVFLSFGSLCVHPRSTTVIDTILLSLFSLIGVLCSRRLVCQIAIATAPLITKPSTLFSRCHHLPRDFLLDLLRLFFLGRVPCQGPSSTIQ